MANDEKPADPQARLMRFLVALLALLFVVALFAYQIGDLTGGNMITFQITASDVHDLAGAQVDLRFNPAVVKLEGVEEGDFLRKGGAETLFQADSSSASQGLLKNVINVRLADTGVSGSGVLATLYFTKESSGDAGIQITEALLSDSNAAQLPSDRVMVSKK